MKPTTNNKPEDITINNTPQDPAAQLSRCDASIRKLELVQDLLLRSRESVFRAYVASATRWASLVGERDEIGLQVLRCLRNMLAAEDPGVGAALMRTLPSVRAALKAKSDEAEAAEDEAARREKLFREADLIYRKAFRDYRQIAF